MRSVTFLVLVLLVATVAVGPATAAEDEMPDNCKVAPTLEPGTHEFTIQERKDVDTFKIDFEDHDTAYTAVSPDPGETEMFVYAVPTYHDLTFDDPVPADIVTYAGNGQGVWSTYEVDEVSWKMRSESTGTACVLIYESVYQESEFPYDYEVRISFNEEPDWWAPLREQLDVDAREGTGVLTRNMPETPRRTTTPTATTRPAETTPSTTRRPARDQVERRPRTRYFGHRSRTRNPRCRRLRPQRPRRSRA